MKPLKTLACVMAMAVPSMAHAQAVPATLLPGTLLSNEIETTVTEPYGTRYYTCQIAGVAISEFQRTGSGPAIMTVSNLSYYQNRPRDQTPVKDFYYPGVVVFNFKTLSSGEMHFSTPPVLLHSDNTETPDLAHQDVPFSKYIQSYDPTTKNTVSGFPDRFCVLQASSPGHLSGLLTACTRTSSLSFHSSGRVTR